MNETKQLLEHAERAFDPPTDVMEALVDRRDRKHRNERLRAGALGLAIAVAIGWLSVSAIRSAPVPADPVIRENGEVLRFTGRIERYRLPDGSILKPMPGDLVAVDPRSGAERVLVEDLDAVYWAGWSADGRWYAYETDSAEGVWHRDVWVAGGSQAPRVVATIDDGIFGYGPAWQWSPTGAELATVDHEEARTIDVATGTAETTDLGPAVAGVGSPGSQGDRRGHGHRTGGASCSRPSLATVRSTRSTCGAESVRSSLACRT